MEKIREEKDIRLLKRSDIILNLKEIKINNIDTFSSSSCSGNVRFNIICQTKHGYCEDPNFFGDIIILKTKKCKEKDTYLLKVKFDKEEYE